MAKRKARFQSLSTPGTKQDCSNYLVELAFLRQNHGKRLPPKFWQQTRYKFKYRREIQACRKFIKKYGESKVLYVATHNKDLRSWTDFGRVEFLLQQLSERDERRALPKDNTGVPTETVHVDVDLRNQRPRVQKKGLFDRLKELRNGQEESSAV